MIILNYTVRITNELGQIFDAKGVALTTNQSKDIYPSRSVAIWCHQIR